MSIEESNEYWYSRIESTKNIRQGRTKNSFCSNFHPPLFDTINSSSDRDTTVISIKSNLNRTHNHIYKCTRTLYILNNNLSKNKASVKNITLYFRPIFPINSSFLKLVASIEKYPVYRIRRISMWIAIDGQRTKERCQFNPLVEISFAFPRRQGHVATPCTRPFSHPALARVNGARFA